MSLKKIKNKAYAKINLFLSITGIREDGYHILSSIMQTVSLYDTVTVKKADKLNCICGEIPSQKNIAYKAVRALEEISGKELPAEIKIKKRIPDKAGLGGGSADAAAAMRAVIKLYDLNLNDEEIISAAAKAGADVPFLYFGGAALCRGIGEIMERKAPLPDCFIVIAKPEKGNSTPEMFRRFDEAGKMSAPPEKEFSEALEKGDLNEIASLLKNDLFPFDMSGEALPLKEKLLALGAVNSEMTGSGTAVFALFDDKKKAKKALKALKKNYKAYLVKPI
ncbi:MAG: 4-(cytidine 5'-diphospho)-2-C-methyl-D-erythritol kinase [Oscillospiraceae bacterium]|nr:4-(cytidine 5'-diphospho)-2-C-methyl-D-erythritol kinase [Oscillospiraceae bacterium]